MYFCHRMRALLFVCLLIACAAWYRDSTYYESQSDDKDAAYYSFDNNEELYEVYDDLEPFPREDKEVGDTADLFYNMIGDRLYKIVGNVPVLWRAVEAQHREQSSVRFGCTDYKFGGDLARSFRSDPNTNTTLIPTLVDFARDIMCFLIATVLESNYDPLLDRSKALYHEPVPPILKLEEGVYQIIEEKAFERSAMDVTLNSRNFDSLDLKIYYRPEVFQHVVDPYASSFDYSYIYKHYKIALEKVALYDLTSLDDFLFSTDGYEKFFKKNCNYNDESNVVPCRRRDNWVKLRKAYKELVVKKRDLTSRYGLERAPEYDPCHYESLFHPMEYTEHYLRMPLSGLAKIPDDLTRSACLANIVSMFGGDQAASFIAIEPRPRTLSFHARSITQSAQVNADLSRQPYTAAGLRGDNQVVGISDTGLDVNNCYFYDNKGRVQPTSITSPRYDPSYRKVLQYLYNGCGDSNDEEAGHGTHVAGIAVGNIDGKDIGTDGKYDGVAPNAKVSFADLSKSGAGLCIPPVSQLYPSGRAAGARVFSNSWGTYFSSGTGYYFGQDMDTWLYQNMDSTVFFAAGNVGNIRSITRESSSKNVISVGSSHTTLGSDNITYVAFYSSRGPVYDNRFKPDMVSPGHQLNAARASGTTSQTCDTVTYTGTSMATPAAAGVALMIRQYFLDSRFWPAKCNSNYRNCRAFAPSGVLVRAIMVHGGARMALFNGGGSNDVPLGAPPDWSQGFGRIALYNVLPIGSATFDLFVADAVNVPENSEVNFNVNVKASDRELRATLCWYDPPNVQGTTGNALLNDLDLTLTSPKGEVRYPNNRPSADQINNNERVVVNSPQTGVWKVKIRGRNLPASGNQLFSLVVTSNGYVSYA